MPESGSLSPNLASLQPSVRNDPGSSSSSITLSERHTPYTKNPEPEPKISLARLRSYLTFEQDPRAQLHPQLSRFLGFRADVSPSEQKALPFLPFSWLHKIPIRYETWIFATIGSFVSILLIEAIMSTSTAFRDAYKSPLIIVSFGASAVLMFGVTEAPLGQPRNAVLGQVVSALVGTVITRLWMINHPDYVIHLGNQEFYAPSFVNGALCMSIALLVQLALGIVHPPGGATALAAATEASIVSIGWDYIPVILASSLIMLGWALIVNNLGRKRYPMYWWAPGGTFEKAAEMDLHELEAGDLEEKLEKDVDTEAMGEELAMTRMEQDRALNSRQS